jgi:DNA-binding helix-hairpin-helix protein with protein kinase domain
MARSANIEYTIEELLGGGAQGEVYRVRNGASVQALKWYYAASATARQASLIAKLVDMGPPHGNFLWPADFATAQGVPGFGYFMRLREPRFQGLVQVMKRRVDPSFRALSTAGFELAHSFLQLHSKGLCYHDISFGNLFLDPATGETLICDNDNVTVDGDSGLGVLGTPRFMAPEVVTGTAHPGIQTDLFSLAILLFYLFVLHHPLEGAKEIEIHSFDLPAMNRLYGAEPVFIFDPDNDSNRPVPGYHDNALAVWPVYPKFLQDLFIRAFTTGISDPAHGRVRESEWRAAMVRLRDSIVYCEHCGSENFYDRESLRDASGGGICWHCQRRYRTPFRIRVGRHIVVLNHDTKLFPHHVDEQRLYDFSAPVAAIRQHPTEPGRWGLENVSMQSWFLEGGAGAVPREIAPGRTVALSDGARIHFGASRGEIRA